MPTSCCATMAASVAWIELSKGHCMTIKLYYVDTDLHKATAKVVTVETQEDTYAVELDQTIFHPQGGGQPSDVGTLSGIPVSKVILSDNGKLFHLISKENYAKQVFTVGNVVELMIDGDLRNRHAALHTTGHLIDIVVAEYMPYRSLLFKPRGNHFPSQAKVTYEYDVNNGDLIEASKEEFNLFLESKVAQYIQAALPIRIDVDSQQQHRKIGLGDYPAVGCGGTHVKNTKQLHNFTVRKIKMKKGLLTIGYDCNFLASG